MASKLSPHLNILQPSRQNSSDNIRLPKGVNRQGIGSIGQTLHLNGVSIGVPTLTQGTTTTVNNNTAKKGSNNMAKRNARERNRVKQVNLGFHSLRQHIPEGYRMKKMSKVDTLRCAVEYIRSMEQILDITPSTSEVLIRDGSYQSYSSAGMNQCLDKNCSMDDASISLDQSFSSFSENEDSSALDGSSSSENQLNASFHDTMGVQNLVSVSNQEQCEPSIAIVTSEGDKSSFENLVGSNDAHTSILVPVQFHSMNKNVDDMVPSDENFNPPASYIRVVEIHLQS